MEIIRSLIPRPVRSYINRIKARRRYGYLSELTPAEAFDEVYRRRFWQQGNSLSGSGSEGRLADAYVSFVVDYIKKTGAQVVVDAGCGDFSVGSRLAEHCDIIHGVDISSEIIGQNKRNYANLPNARFGVLNLMEDPIPECDLLLVRQVLQHLDNDQIERVLQNIEASSAKRVLITEHSIIAAKRKAVNIDLGSHSVITRVQEGSGVDIGAPPFSRHREIIAELVPGPENKTLKDSVLYIYEIGGRGTT